MQKYNYILQSFINGQISQGKSQFAELSPTDRIELLSELARHSYDGHFEELYWPCALSYSVLQKLIKIIY
jgi:hypothetical protein